MRAVENHGIRQLPYRIKSRYSPEGERFQDAARFTSLYFDAPVKTKVQVEQALSLNEQVMRATFLRPESVEDEVRLLCTCGVVFTTVCLPLKDECL